MAERTGVEPAYPYGRRFSRPLHYHYAISPHNLMSFDAQNILDVMKSIANSTKNIILIYIHSVFNNIKIKLTIRSYLQCFATAAIDVIDLQNRKITASAIGTLFAAEPFHCFLSYFLVLFTPFSSFLFSIVVCTFLTTFAPIIHILSHMFTVL